MMSHGMSALLLTSAAGYWVLTASGKEKGRVKMLGQYLGFLIIILTLAATASQIYCYAKMKGYCPSGGRMACPFTGKSAPMQPSQ